MLISPRTCINFTTPCLLGGVVFLGCLFLCFQVQSQTPTAPHTSSASAKVESSPYWKQLSENEKIALAPLSKIWPVLGEPHKRKWLALSKNFADLSKDEQSKLQSRMRDWATLSAQQRAQARLNFAEVSQLSADEKLSKWDAYLALPPQDRQKLSSSKPVAKGAATALRPIDPQKLTSPPSPKPDQVSQPRVETEQVHPVTLLPIVQAPSQQTQH
ncbi:MAG: DUF3106 domain-containing protein [Limnohabitans sp.]|nr:DUF3106 domain-containing protein [Limnohabitans sp.]